MKLTFTNILFVHNLNQFLTVPELSPAGGAQKRIWLLMFQNI